MKTLFYSVKDFETPFLQGCAGNADMQFTDKTLSAHTVYLAKGFETISVFTGDDASGPVIEQLAAIGVRFIATRAAGYDNIDLEKALTAGIRVANVPAYSPHAIAEHALALMLALDRRLILADKQVHEQNFTVGNLTGFDLHGKTIGVIGTGKIGSTLVKMLQGFGCRLLGYDVHENTELTDSCGLEYVPLPVLCREAHIISIHTCLSPDTRYLVNSKLIELMRPGVMLINTGRGACVNTKDVLHYLQNGHIGYFGTDVYEKEKGLFFYDWTGKPLQDDVLKELMALPNVLITPHQAFATEQALTNIAQTTFYNIDCWQHDRHSENELLPDIQYACI